jgi:hypothetical protein
VTVKCEVKFLFGVVFDGDLTDFVQSDNVYYVRLAQHFSHYNDFNGTIKSLLPLQNLFPKLIVKDRKSYYISIECHCNEKTCASVRPLIDASCKI